MHSLVSFLGRGRYRPDGTRGDYLTARYQFNNSASTQCWTSPACKLFAFAAYEFHRQIKSPFDKVTILGTSGSMWDALADSFGMIGSNSLSDSLLNLVDAVDQERVTQTELDTYAVELSDVLSIRFRLQLIPAAVDLGDQAAILSQITGAVEAREKIFLDVTHSYRHLPMIGLAAAAISASLQNAKIDEICYGALDMTRSGVTPVISLKWVLQLFRVLNGLNELSRGHQLRPLIECFPNGSIRDALEKAAYKLDVMRIDQAASAVQVALRKLDQEIDQLPIELRIVVDAMMERLQQFSKLSRNPIGLARMAELALDQDDYLRTSVFLAEAVDLANERGITENSVENRKLKIVRHWLAHAGELDSQTKNQDVQNWVSDRLKLRQFFRKHIKRLHKELNSN